MDYFYQPSQGHRLKFDPFKSIVGPRPIAWISTLSQDGIPNLAPYSFFNAVSSTPPIIAFSSVGYKDTLRNIEHSGEFAWNLVSRDLAEAMNLTGQAVMPDVNEFELAELEQSPSNLIATPRVARSLVSFECRKTQILQLETTSNQKLETWVIFGEVIGVHIRAELLSDGTYQCAASHPILRGGGWSEYFEITHETAFHLQRAAARR